MKTLYKIFEDEAKPKPTNGVKAMEAKHDCRKCQYATKDPKKDPRNTNECQRLACFAPLYKHFIKRA